MLRKTILIADDDARLLEALRIRLEHQNFDVIMSGDCVDAVDFALRTQPDLIVLDVNMPGGSGFTAMESMRQDAALAKTPVIIITGIPAGQIDVDARNFGAFGVLHKPFEAQDLVEMIRNAIARKAA